MEFPAHKLGTYEIILGRLSWILAAKLQPLVFNTAQAQSGAKMGSSSVDAVEVTPAKQLGSFFDLSLLCHHIILDGGEDLYRQAQERPSEILHAVMPLVYAHATDTWCACTPIAVKLPGGTFHTRCDAYVRVGTRAAVNARRSAFGVDVRLSSWAKSAVSYA